MARGSSPKNVRQAVTRHEGNAHLYAAFGTHWRAGVASLIPFGILFFTTQPFGDAMAALTSGGYTVGPAIVVTHATVWALMSFGLLHLLRFSTSIPRHYLTYAGVGGATLLVFAMLALTVVQLFDNGTADFWNRSAFVGFLWGAPLLGAIGSVIGRRALASGISWHIWIERGPLPQVFDYVEGKHDKDDFQRM